MTIGIDCRLAGDKHAGIGRYVEELVRFVIQDESINWVLFFFEQNQLPWLPNQKNIKIVIAPIRHYTIAEQLFMPGIFSKENLDLLHVPHFNIPLLYTKPIVVTIHDLLWHEQQGAHVTTLAPLTYMLKYRAYRFVTSQAIKKAQKIFVPTQTVQETIKRLEPGIITDKIVVTYEGIGEKYQVSPLRQGSAGQANLNVDENNRNQRSKVLFYTGSLYPHKNVLLIVKALKELPEYELCISSSRNVFVDEFLKEVENLGMSKRVHHLGRLTDVELIEQYRNTTALVQPSLSEGFGLTGLEAIACGLPVLASDIPVFNEVYKDGFISFDPHSVASFVQAVHTLEKTNIPVLTQTAKAIAGIYSWEKMGRETVAIYKSLLTARHS